MAKKLNTRTGYAIVCGHCDCGDVLIESNRHLLTIFDTKEDAMSVIEGSPELTEEHIVKVRIGQHG